MIIEMFQPAIFLDTETTGIADCRLVELAWATHDGEIESIRVKPPIPIEQEAIAVHGITEDDVRDLPSFEDDDRYEEVKKLLEHSVVFAHNASFDIGVLAREGIIIRNFVDTKPVAKRLYPEAQSLKLQSLREYLGIDIPGLAHSAAGDVAVLRELYKRMAQDAARA